MLGRLLLTPKIGTGKRLTCEPNLAEEHHSAGGVTLEFSAPNKSPNKSRVFSKLTRRAQLPFKP
jgi:hypothetical protein